MGRVTAAARRGATEDELSARRWDIGAGTLVSNGAMFFIILTTALTLHANGITELTTSREVAEALEPLAGRFAKLLYAIGLIGTGALAIPTLAGSASYAFSEIFGWRQGMDEKVRRAPTFYASLVVAVICGAFIDFSSISAIQAMYWSAVVNGLLAPFLLVGILVVASDSKVMQRMPSPMFARVIVGFTAVAMFGAAIAMFVV